MENKKQDFLYIVWKNPASRRNYIVGQLSFSNVYHFCYSNEYQDALKSGWKGLEAFPNYKIDYESKELFPIFASRLPDPKRRDIKEILEKYEMTEYNPYELLKRNGGRLPIDNYEFICPIYKNEKTQKIQLEFFVMGVRHLVGCDGKNCTKLLDLTADTQLYLNPEPQNKYDRYAIQIVTKDKKLLGYVPRYYSEQIFNILISGTSYFCKVIEVNGEGVCAECIKVRLKIPNDNME